MANIWLQTLIILWSNKLFVHLYIVPRCSLVLSCAERYYNCTTCDNQLNRPSRFGILGRKGRFGWWKQWTKKDQTSKGSWCRSSITNVSMERSPVVKFLELVVNFPLSWKLCRCSFQLEFIRWCSFRLEFTLVSFTVSGKMASSKIKLRGYQQRIVNTLVHQGNTIAVLPTGSGKTLIAAGSLAFSAKETCGNNC